MTNVSETIAARFERAAASARLSEDVYRKQAAAEIGRLAAERLRAYRRLRLISLLEEAAASAENEATMLQAQRQRLCSEFGWTGDAEAQVEVLDRLDGVCRALQPKSAARLDTIGADLQTFEDWFEASRKVSFYALFDKYVQETPVVDF